MSVPKALIISAIPFSMGHIQPIVNGNTTVTADSNIVNRSNDKRKRRRFDHLSIHEKLQRRKILNREAAQNARDKAKQHMSDLEKHVIQLQKENNGLLMENMALKESYFALQLENSNLKRQIVSMPENKTINLCETNEKKKCSKASFEHASLINVPLLKEQDLWTYSLLLILTIIGEILSARSLLKICPKSLMPLSP